MKAPKWLKRWSYNLAKENIMFRYVFRKLLFLKRYLNYSFSKITNKTDEKMVIFMAYDGRSYACSPKSIYEYMISDNKYKDYTFVWAFKDLKSHNYLTTNPNTVIVKTGGKKFRKYMAKAKYMVSNWRLPDHIYPKKDQVFLQCWHGTPLKRLGFDIDGGKNALNTQKELQKKYITDAKKITYMLSPSKFATEKFISSFALEKLNKSDCIIEKGYPRNEFLFNYKEEDVLNIKKKLGIDNIKNKKILLYAPTWRDNQHTSGLGYTLDLGVDFDNLKVELSDKYIILFRPHYLVANKFDFEKYEGFIYDVSEVEDINELYIVSDILMTDYSSVFFDYANLRKPIIFYMYDLDFYKDILRGFYIDIKTLPGDIIKREDKLIQLLKTDVKVDQNKMTKFNKTYNYLDNGNVSKEIVREVFK